MKLFANHRVLSVDVEKLVSAAVILESVTLAVVRCKCFDMEAQAAEEGIPGLRGQEVEEPVAAGIQGLRGQEVEEPVAAGIREALEEEEKVVEMEGAATAVAAAWVYMGYHNRCT